MKKYLRKFLKILLWIIGSIITIMLLLLLLIQIPYVQNIIKDQAISFIEGKIETPVSIDNLEIGFPKKIILNGFYFEDQNRDTLAAGERLAVNIDFYKLIGSTIEISSIELEGAVANISRDKDSVFNFDYIIEAFATDQPQDTTAAMDISIGTVELDRIKFRMIDAITNSDINVNLGHLDTRIGTFDPDNMTYEIPEINVNGFDLKMDQEKMNPSVISQNSDTNQPEDLAAPLNLTLGDISLSNINIVFNSEDAGIESNFGLKELVTEINELELEQEYAEIETLEINGLKGFLTITETPSAENTQDTLTSAAAANNWKILLKDIDLKGLAFNFKDENAPQVPQGINYKDLELTNLNLEANDLYYSLDSISGNINSFTLQDKSGLDIQSLQTEFLYTNTSAYLKDLYLQTPNTLLQDRIMLNYTSIESLENNLGEVTVEANLENSKLGFTDVLILAPDLRNTPPFSSTPNAVVSINGEVSGKINDLTISNLEASGIGSTSIAINGNITGLPEAENAYYNLNIRNFRTTARDIDQFLPAGTIPDSIQLPESFSATGNFKGTADNFDTRLNLKSSSGNALVDANIDMRRENAEVYIADVTLDDFDLGRLIQNDSIGELTLNVKVEGTGFDPSTANANASGTIEKAEYNSYVYRDLQFKGKIQDGDLNADAVMDDPNLDFNLNVSGNFQGEYPSIQLTADLNNVALDSLNLYGSPLRFEGKITADLKTADPDHLNGEISITNLIATNASQSFPLDTITLRSTASAEVDSLVLRSQFLNARMQGNYQLTQIGPALTKTISRYYDLSTPGDVAQDTTVLQPQKLAFEVNFNNDPILNQLIPQLDLMEPVAISGGFNSETDSLLVNGNLPRFKYLDYRFANSTINIEIRDNALTYEVIIDDVDSPQIQLFHTEISGEVQNNEVSYRLLIDDSKGDPHYRVAGLMETADGSNRFSLGIDNLMLNYDIWTIPENNNITITPEGVMAENFNMSHDNNSISINSQTQSPTSPMEIEFDSFQIETISAMISKDTLIAGGTINGNVILNNLTTSPEFNSNLIVDNFTFKRDTVGNLQIQIDNETANSLRADIALSGNGNDMQLSGIYGTENGDLDFDLDMRHLNIKSIQGFSFGSITESTGHLSGDLRIEGTAESPAILGNLDFNDVGFRVTALNSYFQSINDAVTFSADGISLDQFTLSDENNNTLVVDGTLQTSNYIDYGFDLTVNADNFRAMNSTAQDNDLYYGDLILDTRLVVGGNLDQPVVSGNISIKDGTELTIVLPQEDPTIADREGVVEFVDEQSRRLAKLREMEETMNQAPLQGMDVSVNIDIVKEAVLTMVIDEGNGDYLNLQGEAQLTAGIDPSGRTSLTGRYEFTEGAYEMSFNFIRRRFEIEEGSYILWTGEPTTADISITAIYETDAPPIDLLGNQLGDISAGVRNTYKQELPFQTLLKMEGELLEPVLSFDIRLPDRNYNVSTDIINNTRLKLEQLRQQPSELNKQVFALLLLNRFIGENPFASEGGGSSAESLARQSVSKILSQQLNDLAGDLIGGVELNFDLESTEDYTTGQREQRTDLNVGLSKTLLNDRLKVTIGSSFGLEGPQQANQQANNIAGDIALDYQLSQDGRYMLRAYRKNQYQVALQGQIIETGVAFIITMDYNYFMEIFGKDVDE